MVETQGKLIVCEPSELQVTTHEVTRAVRQFRNPASPRNIPITYTLQWPGCSLSPSLEPADVEYRTKIVTVRGMRTHRDQEEAVKTDHKGLVVNDISNMRGTEEEEPILISQDKYLGLGGGRKMLEKAKTRNRPLVGTISSSVGNINISGQQFAGRGHRRHTHPTESGSNTVHRVAAALDLDLLPHHLRKRHGSGPRLKQVMEETEVAEASEEMEVSWRSSSYDFISEKQGHIRLLPTLKQCHSLLYQQHLALVLRNPYNMNDESLQKLSGDEKKIYVAAKLFLKDVGNKETLEKLATETLSSHKTSDVNIPGGNFTTPEVLNVVRNMKLGTEIEEENFVSQSIFDNLVDMIEGGKPAPNKLVAKYLCLALHTCLEVGERKGKEYVNMLHDQSFSNALALVLLALIRHGILRAAKEYWDLDEIETSAEDTDALVMFAQDTFGEALKRMNSESVLYFLGEGEMVLPKPDSSQVGEKRMMNRYLCHIGGVARDRATSATDLHHLYKLEERAARERGRQRGEKFWCVRIARRYSHPVRVRSRMRNEDEGEYEEGFLSIYPHNTMDLPPDGEWFEEEEEDSGGYSTTLPGPEVTRANQTLAADTIALWFLDENGKIQRRVVAANAEYLLRTDPMSWSLTVPDIPHTTTDTKPCSHTVTVISHTEARNPKKRIRAKVKKMGTTFWPPWAGLLRSSVTNSVGYSQGQRKI